MKQSGLAPISILIAILILTLLGVGALYVTNQQNQKVKKLLLENIPSSPAPTAKSNESTTSAETTNLKTYRAPGYIGIKVKYPSDKLIGSITEYTDESKDKPTQDENLILWQTTIPLKNSNILIIRKHNLNLSTNKPYGSVEEYDPRAKNFSTVQVSNNSARDSGEYQTQTGTYQREIIFFRKNYIWSIQEVSIQNSKERYLETILSSWTFFEYNPSETGVYKDVDR